MSDKIFTFRIPEELLNSIRESAEKNKRSIAKEIEYVLEKYYFPTIPQGIDLTPKLEGLVTELLQELGYDTKDLNINSISKPYYQKLD